VTGGGHPDARPITRTAVALAALLAVALAWAATLQTDITAGNDSLTDPGGLVDPLMDDSGEFVVAWHTWGVTHPPGYPLQNLVGNVLARLFGLAGASPAAAAALVSFGFALAALCTVAAVVGRFDRRGPAMACAALLPAFGGLTWLYASVAEVYALGVFLALAVLALALAVGAATDQETGTPEARSPRPSGSSRSTPPAPTWRVLALGLMFGLAVGHHRTLLALAPAVAVAVWPWRPGAAGGAGWRPWLGALVLALLSLGVYAYLPLAALSGSPWVYGRSPATWAGFWDAVLAREYGAQLAPPATLPAIATALVERVAFLAREMTAPGLVLGVAGLGLGLARIETRRPTAVVGMAAAGYLFAPVGQHLLIGTHLLIMVASASLAVGWGLGVAAWAAERPVGSWAALGVTALVAIGAWRAHRADVVTYAGDPAGRRLIEAVKSLADGRAGPSHPRGSSSTGREGSSTTGEGSFPAEESSPIAEDDRAGLAPTLVEAWSPRYFALAYGKWATGELARARLVDARADLSGLGDARDLPPTIYTTPHMLYVVPLDRWAERLGPAVALESAGDGLIALSRAPRLGRPHAATGPWSRDVSGDPGQGDAADAIASGSAVALDGARAWRAADGDIRLTVEWRAVRRPETDYRVFVHVTDRRELRGPGDILAQGDRDHPVYGFYPTSRWQAGQRVRDDFRVALPAGLPADRNPTHLDVGLYTVAADGVFFDELRRTVPIASGPAE